MGGRRGHQRLRRRHRRGPEGPRSLARAGERGGLQVWVAGAPLLPSLRAAAGITGGGARPSAALLARLPDIPWLRDELRRLEPADDPRQISLIEKALETGRLRRDVTVLRGEVETQHRLVVGESPRMREVVELAKRAAASDATVLLSGESGTGKEVFARAVHAWSRRSNGPFVAVNCAALNADLLESELFGHEKGAFTGAVRTKAGRLDLASGGTLFLDEIGDLRPALQVKLLRVLQEREYERVGGTRTLKTDLRVLVATNRDLEAQVAAGDFRQDLYFRLKVVILRLPPLRERREDIWPLADHFLSRYAREAGRATPRLDAAARALVVDYEWPGNVRELANALERAIVLGSGDVLTIDDLPEELHEHSPVPLLPMLPAGASYHDAVVSAKRAILRDALRAEGGHQTRAAKRLGLTQPYLARLLTNLRIRPGEGR